MTSEPPPLDRLASVPPEFSAPVEIAEAHRLPRLGRHPVHHGHHLTVDGGTHS